MSRVAKIPVVVPKNVDITLTKHVITVTGGMGTLSLDAHPKVNVVHESGELHFNPEDMTKSARMAAGTIRSLVNNMVIGVSQGFQKKLELIGVGYRAKATGNVLNLTLGYSHPIEFELPVDVKVDTPSQTEIVLKSSNKQLLGQVAAKIRGYRPPEPYKGKGIRYSDETVLRKEAKKK